MSSPSLLFLVIFTPGILAMLMAVSWLLGVPLSERITSRVTKAASLVLALIALKLGWALLGSTVPVTLSLGSWFEVGHHRYELTFLVDRLSLPFVLATVVLVGIIGSFSVRYIHRDPGFQRFFLLLQLFAFGAMTVFTAGSLDLLIAGWEIIGITSVLLIGFFQYRPEPVRNARRVFGTYRIADLFILSAVFSAHHHLGGASWTLINGTTGALAATLAVLLVFAASGKSAQGPFCGWLPRAMEGPTPSSAVFYGAISVHAGAYLLLRLEPVIQSSAIAVGLILFIGVTTALITTLAQRTSTDAKTSLAYASQTQVSIIFIEIALGWETIAMIHIFGHIMLRTMQFLRAPSMLRDHRRVHSAAGGRLDSANSPLEAVVPGSLRLLLYRAGMGRGFYDALVDRFIIAPTQGLARFLGWFDKLLS
jgi:NADH:ubiquinone oxidoreductase subunit 5 (subunit L)/multisubunit Na+/H+ antiporter MnhA subunit